jgi:ABC-type molybdate transport system substrate-binding protein
MLSAILFHPSDSMSQSLSVNKELIIFHEGSLSVPLKQIAQEYEKINPGTKIFLESAGSLDCAGNYPAN